MNLKKNEFRKRAFYGTVIETSFTQYLPSHVAIFWCPEADIIRELKWYICFRIYAAVKQGLSLTELSPCHALLMQS